MEDRTDTAQIELEVAEAPASDVGMGRVRVDQQTLTVLGISGEKDTRVEGVVQIIGRRSTAAKVFRLKAEDEGRGIIRMDGLLRRNSGAELGDRVEIRKALVVSAERVTLAPIISEGHKISFGQGIENFVKRGLLKRPLMKDDVVTVAGIGLMEGALPFFVASTTPEGIVRVNDATLVTMREVPVLLHENLTAGDIVRAFTRGLRDVLTKSEVETNALEGDLGRRVRETRARILQSLDELDRAADDTSPKGG